MNSDAATQSPQLRRKFGLLHATALNMANMVGVGPFITIPLIMSAMGGPQAMLGWFCAALVAIPDGMVWSELGAAMPGSGGSYLYLRDGFGRKKWGRFMAFMFIWQFILSGPMEIASGYIGFGQYLGYLWPAMTKNFLKLAAMLVGVVNIILLYRRITFIAGLTICLWVGTLLTTLLVILSGIPHFNHRLALDFPDGSFQFSKGFFLGLGSAMQIGLYDYLGYYDVCYIGEEVENPGRVIPRSIMISLIGVALIYFTMNLMVIGVVPWREFVPAGEDNRTSQFVVSIFMEKIFGQRAAMLFTILILWTAFASVFALLLGYSRIPYAAALDGNFFKVFGKLHSEQAFPFVSLLVVGVISLFCCLFDLQTVISALVSIRILVQFVGQIAALTLLRKNKPDLPRPYKMWLYPLPSLVAFVGWMFVFFTSGAAIVLYGFLALALGVATFLIWSHQTRQWPFAAHSAKS